jgi:thiamine biosynthesis lipoprotein
MFTREIHDGAIVTSTNSIRRWVHRGRLQHHLIDPTTGRAADTGLAAVVVADRSTARAEVLAKAAFVAGRERGADLLARFGVDGWFIPLDTAA